MPPFQGTLQSTRGRGSWDPNDGPQSTEVQAVLGFPPDSQVLFLTAAPPAPLPSEHSVEYTKVTFPVKQNLHFLDAFFHGMDEAFMPDLSRVEERSVKNVPELYTFQGRVREQQKWGFSPGSPDSPMSAMSRFRRSSQGGADIYVCGNQP